MTVINLEKSSGLGSQLSDTEQRALKYIMNRFENEDKGSSPEDIATALGISAEQAKTLMDGLVAKGLLLAPSNKWTLAQVDAYLAKIDLGTEYTLAERVVLGGILMRTAKLPDYVEMGLDGGDVKTILDRLSTAGILQDDIIPTPKDNVEFFLFVGVANGHMIVTGLDENQERAYEVTESGIAYVEAMLA